MNSPDPRERPSGPPVSRPTYDTLAHKLARAGYLHMLIYALLIGPIPAGGIYAANFGVSEVVTADGEQFSLTSLAQPIGIAHFVFLGIAILLFGGLFFGPGLKANLQTVNAIQRLRDPREDQIQTLRIAVYAVFVIPILLAMSLGDAVGSDLVRWVATGIGWVTFGAAALLIRNRMQKLFSGTQPPADEENAT